MGKGSAERSILYIICIWKRDWACLSSDRTIINDHLDRAAVQVKSKLEWLLSLEEVSITLNFHYFSEYKSKFLAEYKGWRSDNNLLSKLKWAETIMHSVPSWSAKIGVDQNRDNMIKRALSALNELGLMPKPTDLARLLLPDPMEPALQIMASVCAYFQGELELLCVVSLHWQRWPSLVTYKRISDEIPMAIDHGLVHGLERGIDEALWEGLQITGLDGYNYCKSLVEEASSIASAHQEIQKKMERLQVAWQELRRLM